MPAHSGIPDEALTPFARRLRYWGYEQKPRPLTTYPELAAAMGVSKATMWAWFGQRTRPRPAVLGRVAHATGIPVEELGAGMGYSEGELARAAVYTEDTLDRIAAKIRAFAHTDKAPADFNADDLIAYLEADRAARDITEPLAEGTDPGARPPAPTLTPQTQTQAQARTQRDTPQPAR